MTQLDCTTARDLMLEADLADLRDGSTSELGIHIAQCDACRGVARQLLQSYDELNEGLMALSAAAKPEQARKRASSRPHLGISSPRRLVWASLPLAAAAVLALVLVRHEPPPPPPNPVLARLMFPQTAIATPPAGKQAMIIDRSDATVVWLY
jgi:anti-sigma factor RsiW